VASGLGGSGHGRGRTRLCDHPERRARVWRPGGAIALEHRPSLNPDLGCRESTGTKPRCDALAEALESEFKKGFSRFPAFGSAANDIDLGDDITVESLSVVDNGIGLDKRKWLVLDTVPTKVTSKPNGTVELKTEGKDQDVGGTSYTTVGKVEVGNDTYDIKRGNYSVSHLKKAVLNVEIPAQDGAQAGVGKRCRFIVETKNWKRAGAAWFAKNARLLWVRDAAERR
jgi:hypothetical protein